MEVDVISKSLCQVTVCLVAVVSACATAIELPPARLYARDANSPQRPAAIARRVKVLILYDLEGVTSVTSARDVQFGAPSYRPTQESLTEDVNAAIRGLLKAGATEIVITDGHGSGNPDPDYLVDRLPDGARLDTRDEPYDAYIDSIDKSFAAVVAIGMHSGAGTDGFLSHTYFGHTKWTMGGLAVNESMLLAASAARFDVPLVMVTGDQVLHEEVATFSPATAFVAVKQSESRDKTQPRAREEVSAEIEGTAERALRNRAAIKPWRPAFMRAPFDNLFAYRLPEMASMAVNFPSAQAVDNKTVRLRTSTFLDAYLAFRALAFFTAFAPYRLTMDLVRQVEGGPSVIRQAQAKGARPGGTGFDATGPALDLSWSAMGRHGYK